MSIDGKGFDFREGVVKVTVRHRKENLKSQNETSHE
jgi:hypothetical protein